MKNIILTVGTVPCVVLRSEDYPNPFDLITMCEDVTLCPATITLSQYALMFYAPHIQLNQDLREVHTSSATILYGLIFSQGFSPTEV